MRLGGGDIEEVKRNRGDRGKKKKRKKKRRRRRVRRSFIRSSGFTGLYQVLGFYCR